MSTLADIYINMSAAAGVAALALGPALRTASDSFERSLTVVAGLSCVFLATRAAFWMSGWAWLEGMMLVAASLLPLSVLLATERLGRRHAPRPLKFLAIALPPAMTVLVLLGAFGRSMLSYGGFAVAFFGVLLSCAVLIARLCTRSHDRDRRIQAGLFLCALALAIVLGVTDFAALVDLPVRLGAMAVALLGYAVASAQNPDFTLPRILAELVLIVGITCAFVAMAHHVGAMPGPLLPVGVLLGVIMLGAVAARRALDGTARAEDRYDRRLLGARTDTPEDFVGDALSGTPGERFRVLDGAALADFDPAFLRDTLAKARTVSRADLDRLPREAADRFRYILDDHGGEHILAVRQAPLSLAVIPAAPMAQKTAFGTHLRRVAKVLPLIDGATT